MRAVGIRELKDHLSRHLAEVRTGEVILVSDRGVVVAEIRPPGSAQAPLPRGLARMASSGRVRLGMPHEPALYRDDGRAERVADGTARALLDEDRGER
jgi:antitoxin (DNA-binding transcriptional repressor) of toxin-antitoxin stability system